jgi:hypothetical protein
LVNVAQTQTYPEGTSMLKTVLLLALAFVETGVCAESSQSRMVLCSSQANGKSGSDRAAFMRECLTAGTDQAADAGTDSSATGGQQTSYVVDFDIDQVNSAGGVEPFALLSNPDKKTTIKYVRMEVSAYNAVGDQVGSRIGGGRIKRISFTGPLRYEDGVVRADWEPVWYNSTVTCVKIQSVSVELMSGKTLAFSGSNLSKALSNTMSNVCKPQ